MKWVKGEILEQTYTTNEVGDAIANEPTLVKRIDCLVQPNKSTLSYQMYGDKIYKMIHVTTHEVIDRTPNTLFGYEGAYYKIVSLEKWGRYVVMECDLIK